MDRISNCDTNKFVYLVVHIIKFLTKINIILKKTKINNFVQKNVAYTKKKKKKKKKTKRKERKKPIYNFNQRTHLDRKPTTNLEKLRWRTRLWG